MPILGIGTDIVEVRRIRDVCEREPGFVERVFTPRELAYSLDKETKYCTWQSGSRRKKPWPRRWASRLAGRMWKWPTTATASLAYYAWQGQRRGGQRKGTHKHLAHASIRHRRGYRGGAVMFGMRVVTAQEMRDLDKRATEKYGIPSILLMENAGRAVYERR